MIEPVTTTALLLWVDRVYNRAARARQRDRLLALAAGLPPGSEIEERYARGVGWRIRLPTAADGVCEDDR